MGVTLGEARLPREQSDKRKHSPALHSGRTRGLGGTNPKLLSCKGDSGIIVLSNSQDSVKVDL